MKITIFKACLVGILTAFSITTYAADPATGDYNKVVKDYIDSHMNANYKNLNKVMSDDATFKIPRAENVIVQTKSDIVNEMKKEGALKQNCGADYEVIAKSSALVMVRVDFNYDNCIQQNFLTLEKNADKQWKITQVCKIFNDKDTEGTAPKVIAYN
jgi:Putative lumazine-binding